MGKVKTGSLTYAVVRSHALIADLLTANQMRSIASADSLEEFMSHLAQTPYGQVSLETDVSPSISLERVFYQKFIERIVKLVDIVPSNIGDLLQTYYYMRFETLNLDRIIRGKFSEATPQEIQSNLVPMAPFRAPSYQALSEAADIDALLELLKGTAYNAVAEKLPAYKQYDAIWPLQLELQHLYSMTILKTVEKLPRDQRRMISKIVELEADIENFLVAVKQSRAPKEGEVKPEEMFDATYGISKDILHLVVDGADVRESVESLGEPYSAILAPIYEGDVALIRTTLRSQIYKTVNEARAGNDFGFNPIMAYLVFSELEKDDLVGVAWAKEQGLQGEEFLKYLVVPNIS
ncbi:MAG: V-type ATPase subunit [Candidatus Bathyarchaeota archaeon]|nr:V-type ATPase subunit [Candidatus Bathyarchaeota archaeon]